MVMAPVEVNANCLNGDPEPCVRIDWQPGRGFDVKVDDELLVSLPGAARSFLHPICAGEHKVQVVGVRRYFAVPEGVCYPSDAATFTSTRSCEPIFHRGDSDNNGSLQLTDAVRILNFLFLGTGQIDCMDAADADNNGTVQLTDAVRILNVLFLGVGSIPDPGPPGASFGNKPCGPDPDDKHLGCQRYNKC